VETGIRQDLSVKGYQLDQGSFCIQEALRQTTLSLFFPFSLSFFLKGRQF